MLDTILHSNEVNVYNYNTIVSEHAERHNIHEYLYLLCCLQIIFSCKMCLHGSFHSLLLLNKISKNMTFEYKYMYGTDYNLKGYFFHK